VLERAFQQKPVFFDPPLQIVLGKSRQSGIIVGLQRKQSIDLPRVYERRSGPIIFMSALSVGLRPMTWKSASQITSIEDPPSHQIDRSK
jgi:hypothetical protein